MLLQVPMWKIHAYTLLQLVLTGVVFTCKMLPLVRVGFPILLVLCVPIRMLLLPRFYSAAELEAVSPPLRLSTSPQTLPNFDFFSLKMKVNFFWITSPCSEYPHAHIIILLLLLLFFIFCPYNLWYRGGKL